MRGGPAFTVMLIVAGVLVAAGGARAGAADAFRGGLLVVASDGDMRASAYQGDRLGPATRDLLTVIRLNRPLAGVRPATVAVRNSVVGPPCALALTPDGRYAIVAETRGRNTRGPNAKLEDLPPGRALTVVDLRDTHRPKVVQEIIGPENPLSVAVSPGGGQVAIAYSGEAATAPLTFYRLERGRLSHPESPVVPGFAPGDALKGAAYHPSGALALVYAKRPRLTFVRPRAARGRIELERWGDDVPLGPTPFEVRFTRDGRFALINDMTVPASGPEVRGTVTSIAVAQSVDERGAPRHIVVSTARTGVMPEGLAVSPDGRWVVTTNLERTAYKASDARQGGFASLTLMRLDPADGQLTRVADRTFNGVIPEGVVFDDTSRQLAVICFDHFRGRRRGGSIDFWKLGGDFQDPSRVELTPTGVVIDVARGAQSLEVSR